MEKQIEMMKQASARLETIEGGLIHVKQLLNEGKQEQSTVLFSDIIQGFSTVEASLTGLSEEVKSKLSEEQTGESSSSI